MINALPYLLLVGLYGFLACVRHNSTSERTRLYIDMGSVAVFVFFFGFRGFIMYDWSTYYPVFMNLPDFHTLFTLPLNKWPWEIGFTLLGTTCHSLFPDWSFFVLVCCLINTTLLVRFLKQYDISLPLGLMIYLCMNGIIMSTDLMRNSIAILIFANAIPYLRDRRPLPYFALCVVSALFHYSGWVFLPFYFFLHRRINKWILLSIFIVACGVYAFHISIYKSLVILFSDYLGDYARWYLNIYTKMDQQATIISIGFLERLFTGIITFLYIDKLRSLRPDSDIFINSLYLCLYLFLFFSEFRTIGLRTSILFSVGYWVIWIDLIRCFYYQNNRHLYIAFVAVYCLLKTYSSNTDAVNRYENILFDSMNYNERLIYFRQHFNDSK